MKKIISIALGSLIATPVMAEEAPFYEALDAWFLQGKPSLELRYRYEYVDDDKYTNKSKASTLRTHVGFQTGEYMGVSGYVEIEDVSAIGDDDYNSGINGRSSFPTVADPDKTELNQLYVSIKANDDTTLKLGRQKILHDKQRFVGAVNHRQNNQTFDAVTFTNTALDDLKLTYSYVAKANRILSDEHPLGDFDGNMHLMNANYQASVLGEIGAYGYMLDIYNAPAQSSNTFGAFIDGEQPLTESTDVLYRVELARQKNAETNPNTYEANYMHVNAGVGGDHWSVRAGLEILGSDNGQGFSTPLATLHKYNGWADKFLSTPAQGLEDMYVQIHYKIKGLHEYIDGTKLKLHYHQFDSDVGNVDYGSEINFDITKKILDSYKVGFTYASYDADQFSTDKQKFLMTLQYNYK